MYTASERNEVIFLYRMVVDIFWFLPVSPSCPSNPSKSNHLLRPIAVAWNRISAELIETGAVAAQDEVIPAVLL